MTLQWQDEHVRLSGRESLLHIWASAALERRISSHASCDFVYISVLKNNCLLVKSTTSVHENSEILESHENSEILSEADFHDMECEICETQAYLVEFKPPFL